jgi:hypothetical protein
MATCPMRVVFHNVILFEERLLVCVVVHRAGSVVSSGVTCQEGVRVADDNRGRPPRIPVQQARCGTSCRTFPTP